MPDKTSLSPEAKARRSSIAASLLALSAGGTASPAIDVLRGGSIPLGVVMGALAASAAILAFMAGRASLGWRALARAGRERTDVSQAVALSDAQEHLIYASIGKDPKGLALAEAELHAAREMRS